MKYATRRQVLAFLAYSSENYLFIQHDWVEKSRDCLLYIRVKPDKDGFPIFSSDEYCVKWETVFKLTMNQELQTRKNGGYTGNRNGGWIPHLIGTLYKRVAKRIRKQISLTELCIKTK